MSTQQWVVLGCAVAALVVGLLLVRDRHRVGETRARTRLVVGWLVLALCPVFLVFLFFPDSTLDGEFGWGQASGAIAAFLVVWWAGARTAVQAHELERREEEVRTREVAVAAASVPSPEWSPILGAGDVLLYQLTSRPRRVVGIVPGGIEHVRFADVWVNSENTNMQMARFYDRAISGAVRYLGATRDDCNEVVADVIGAALAARMGERRSVPLGTVFDTEPGELARTHGVRQVLHVATVEGQFNRGYRVAQDVGDCVHKVLQCAERLAERDPGTSSLLLPLLGAGSAKGELGTTVPAVLNAVLDHLQNDPTVRVSTVYVLAFTEPERSACRLVLDHDVRLGRPATVNRATLVEAHRSRTATPARR